MLFKLDENLPGALAGLFAKAGHDAVTVSEQEMTGASDPSIVAVCCSEGRALVTLDMDFADIGPTCYRTTLGWWYSGSADTAEGVYLGLPQGCLKCCRECCFKGSCESWRMKGFEFRE